MSSVTGEQVQLSIFGESHGPAIGCVIDGLPAGIPVNLDAIYKDMARRAPGRDKTATPRLEKDIPHIRFIWCVNSLTKPFRFCSASLQ